MKNAFSIRILTSQDLPQIVSIHLAAFPESALTRLGSEVVSRYNRWLLEGPHDCLALGAFIRNVSEPEKLVGFCLGGVFRKATLGFLQQNRGFLAWKLITHPWYLANPIFRERFHIIGKAWLKRLRLSSSEPVSFVPLSGKSFGILSIAVRPEYRGQGIGQKLMIRSEAQAISNGFSAMHLTVHPDNSTAILFYQRLGFVYPSGVEPWKGNMSKQLLVRNHG